MKWVGQEEKTVFSFILECIYAVINIEWIYRIVKSLIAPSHNLRNNHKSNNNEYQAYKDLDAEIEILKLGNIKITLCPQPTILWFQSGLLSSVARWTVVFTFFQNENFSALLNWIQLFECCNLFSVFQLTQNYSLTDKIGNLRHKRKKVQSKTIYFKFISIFNLLCAIFSFDCELKVS